VSAALIWKTKIYPNVSKGFLQWWKLARFYKQIKKRPTAIRSFGSGSWVEKLKNSLSVIDEVSINYLRPCGKEYLVTGEAQVENFGRLLGSRRNEDYFDGVLSRERRIIKMRWLGPYLEEWSKEIPHNQDVTLGMYRSWANQLVKCLASMGIQDNIHFGDFS